MLRFTLCLLFIFSNVVLAQAAETQQPRWITTHIGRTQIEGMNVLIKWEQFTTQGSPLIADGSEKGFLLTPAIKRNFRIRFVMEHNKEVEAIYPLVPHNIFTNDGSAYVAFTSLALDPRGFQFSAVREQNGSIQVSYTNFTKNNQQLNGAFELDPLPLAH